MYKFGDRVVVKDKQGIINTFDNYRQGLPNWTPSKAHMIMFDESMFNMCGQSGRVYKARGQGEEVMIAFDDETLPTYWTWHKDWVVPQMIDNRSV